MLQSKDQQLRKIEEELGHLHEEDSFAKKMVGKASSDAQANIVKDTLYSLNPEQKRKIVASTVQEASSDVQTNIVKDTLKSLNPEQKREIVASTVQEASSDVQTNIVKDAFKSLNPDKQE
jgi:ATP-dependent DNA ligase